MSSGVCAGRVARTAFPSALREYQSPSWRPLNRQISGVRPLHGRTQHGTQARCLRHIFPTLAEIEGRTKMGYRFRENDGKGN